MTSHEPYEIMLGDYMKHALTEEETERFETHLLSCTPCCEQLKLAETLRAHTQRDPDAVRPVEPPLARRPTTERSTPDPSTPERRTPDDYLQRAGELLQGTPWEAKVEAQREELSRSAFGPPAVGLDGERLLVLLHASQIMNSILSLDAIVPRILGLVPRCVRAERSILFLVDEEGKLQPFAQAEVEPRCVDDAAQYSRSILQRTAEDLHILSSGNAMNDERFSAYESIQAFQIKSFMCVPVKSRDKVIGTLYVDNRSLADSFDQKDLAFLRILANQAGTAIENARLHDRLQAENLELSTELARLRQ